MSEMACPSFTDCLCPQTPFRNFSAESPDPALQFAFVYVEQLPQLGDPDNFWGGTAIPAGCERVTSQDAVDCATRTGEELIVDEWRTPDGGPVPLYGNSETTCFTPCPNGDLTEFMIPAGTVVARTQAAADVIAASKCQFEAAQNLSCPPSVSTLPATNVGIDPDDSSHVIATLNAIINPNGSITTYYFEWGTTTSYGHTTPPVALSAGSDDVLVAANLEGLDGGVTYHFRIVAINDDGTSFGGDETFLKDIIAVIDFDFSTLRDLTEAGVVCGISLPGEAAIVDPGDGTVTVISLGGFGGECDCGNVNIEYGGTSDTGLNFNAFWDNTDPNAPDLRNLGFAGTTFSIAEDGFSAVQDLTPLSYLYNPNSGVFTNLGNLGGGQTSIGAIGSWDPGRRNRCINLSHQIACTSKDAGAVVTAARWSAGVLTNIDPLFATPNQDSGTVGIDENGAVLGYYRVGGFIRTFINEGGGAAFSLDIGTFGGYVHPYCLSKHNLHATGEAQVGATVRAFRWKKGTGIALIPLILGEVNSHGFDVNSDGWVVGQSDNFAWLYRPETGTTVDLLTLFPSGSGWTSLSTAEFINDNHQIAGSGIHNGVFKFFMLTLP